MLNIDSLLGEISDISPCGVDLEYDPLFAEMERAKKGTETQQMGNAVNEGEPPDWRLVKKNAISLLKQSHDVRIATTLSMAMLHIHGFAGMAKGMTLLTGLIETYWECIYPEHDPYDDYPIERVNALSELSYPTFVLVVKKQPLVFAKGLGSFSFYDIQYALEHSDEKATEDHPDTALINAAFQACELEQLEDNRQAIADILVTFEKISHSLRTAIGAEYAPDFSAITKLFIEIETKLQSHLPEVEVLTEVAIAPEPMDDDEGNQNIQSAVINSAPIPVQRLSSIENREDVNDALDKICKYYEKYEPGSPVPLFLKRAQRLVDKSFVELMEDLSPNSINDLVQLFGIKDENQ
jgi:type VI secretion system protein ImpA